MAPEWFNQIGFGLLALILASMTAAVMTGAAMFVSWGIRYIKGER